jgi:outer membrane receptor protein involved in Fe transport
MTSLPALAQETAGEGATIDQPAEDIVITGSRITRDGFTTPTPVTMLGAERLQNLGLTNVGEALAQLPSFRATNTPQSGNISSSTLTPVNAGARLADIRGLGATRTLVLVDGRRFVPSTTLGTVDLGLVPTLLVERAEVVTGGASAAYGSDAVSGVVNLILNKKLTGIRASAQYGVTQQGDGKSYAFQLAGGTSFAGGAGHLVMGGEYERSLGAEGCYSRPWCAIEVADVTGAGSATRPAHNIERDVHTSTATLGGLITATIRNGVSTAARGGPLSGVQFAADGSPTQFTYGSYANAIFQVGGSGHGENVFLGTPLLSIPTTRYNGFLHADYELSDSIALFVEGSYGHGAGFSRGPEVRDLGFPSAGNVIQRDNPYLPASIRNTMAANGIDALNIGKLGVDLGYAYGRSKRDTWRTAAGLSG